MVRTVQMSLPTQNDWSFGDIEGEKPERGKALCEAGNGSQLISALNADIRDALLIDAFRISVDSKRDEFKECRFSLKFKVHRVLYDWVM